MNQDCEGYRILYQKALSYQRQERFNRAILRIKNLFYWFLSFLLAWLCILAWFSEWKPRDCADLFSLRSIKLSGNLFSQAPFWMTAKLVFGTVVIRNIFNFSKEIYVFIVFSILVYIYYSIIFF